MRRIHIAVLIGFFIVSLYWLRHEKDFDVTIVNSGDCGLKEATVDFNNFTFNFGYLAVSKNLVKSASYGSAGNIWPTEIEVNWTEESDPEVIYKKVISIRPKLRPSSDETLELMIRIENGKICAYPKVWSVSNGLKNRYDQDEPCQFE